MTASGPSAAAGADDRYARSALSFLADPGDMALGCLLRSVSPAGILALVLSGQPVDSLVTGPGPLRSRDFTGMSPPAAASASGAALGKAVERWRVRLVGLPSPGRLTAWEETGYRLVCPGDPEWPSQLDDLGDARPFVLWVRGASDLRYACLRSVSVVGARAATAYGTHVAGELAADLASRGWAVISGGAYGIDASAHRGALAIGGCTVAVLASGLRFGYPKGHRDLFDQIEGHGVLVSECPPDRAPTRPGFLVRNRVIAALSRGTVIVEAALRSGALNTARQAGELNRPVMAVPGPVTSDQSAGCHELIRECRATCVTGVGDVLELVMPLGEAELSRGSRRKPAVPAAVLDPVTAMILRAVPRRSGRGPATIATIAGVDLDTAMRCLGLLAASGHIERTDGGWRVKPGTGAAHD
jgi:DNA processing protein